MKSGTDQLDWSLKRANILKPQDAFDRKANNFESGPWKPLLTAKPHATVPLEDSLVTFIETEYNTVQYGNPQPPNSLIISQEGGLEPDVDGDTMMTNEDATLATTIWFRATKEMKKSKKKSKKKRSANSVVRYKHPYEVEIQNMKYPAQVYEKREPQKYLPVENTPAIWVDTFEGVLEMLEELKKAKEIAVDLEHHDFRTYAGLLSLMQISTREKDWIIDTLVPWRHKLEVLNEVFADPSILKVSHGLLCNCRFDTYSLLGASRCIYGHHLASERSRPLHRWALRHLSCQFSAWVLRQEPGISPQEVCGV